MIKELPLMEQIETLTDTLVRTLSINGTVGEIDIADQIEAILRSFPYFAARPDLVWTQPLPNDAVGRKNVFAHIRGAGMESGSAKAVLLHCHMDTVGIDDFGELESIAHRPDELLRFFQSWEGDPAIRNQALSGQWMFGRGALDMKSGIAVHLANVLYFSEHAGEWAGDIVLMVNPVEENEHSGVIAAIDELLRLRREAGLDFVAAINNDFITPLYPGDQQKYIYTGAVGKLLPCFYVYGRETHVGQTLQGLDPTLVTSEINRLVSNNMELAERIDGEFVLPPSTLYHRDGKQFYNVQTSVTSRLYFNYMVYERSPKEIMDLLKRIALDASDNIGAYYRRQYEAFTTANSLPDDGHAWDLDVLTFEELCADLEKQGIDAAGIAKKTAADHRGMEPRELCFLIVDRLRKAGRRLKPCVVLFFAPPYCPHNYLKGASEREQSVLQAIEQVTADWISKSGEVFAVKQFFPFLSDSSYLSLHDTDEEIASLIQNFPEWDTLYPVPIDKIKDLNIPAINVGVYGMDAHRWTERVYKPYSFQTLPLLLRSLIRYWLSASIRIDTQQPR